jgi:general stress protein YciG
MRTCKHCETKFDQDLDPPICSKKFDQYCEPKPRGFAALSKKKISEISSKGGKTAHQMGKAHKFSSDEGRMAGKTGGLAPHVSRGPEKGCAMPSRTPPRRPSKRSRQEASA